jgi:hypothetical protein
MYTYHVINWMAWTHFHVELLSWQKIWQVDIIIRQVRAELCHHNFHHKETNYERLCLMFFLGQIRYFFFTAPFSYIPHFSHYTWISACVDMSEYCYTLYWPLNDKCLISCRWIVQKRTVLLRVGSRRCTGLALQTEVLQTCWPPSGICTVGFPVKSCRPEYLFCAME